MRPATTRQEIRRHLGSPDIDVTDVAGLVWRRTSGSGGLHRLDDNGKVQLWTPDDGDIICLPEPPLAEPPDGTRMEFAHYTNVYGAHRDDASSREAGYSADCGWLLYGETIPCTWPMLYAQFGDSLRTAVRLVPVAEDLPNRKRWFRETLPVRGSRRSRRKGAERE